MRGGRASRWLAPVLALGCCLLLVACGSGGGTADGEGAGGAQATGGNGLGTGGALGGGTGGTGNSASGGAAGASSQEPPPVTDLGWYNDAPENNIFGAQRPLAGAPSDSGLTSDAIEGCPDETNTEPPSTSLDGKVLTWDPDYETPSGFYQFLNDSLLPRRVWRFQKTGTAQWVAGCINYEKAEIGTFTIDGTSVTGHYALIQLAGNTAYLGGLSGKQHLQVTIGGVEKLSMYFSGGIAYVNAHYVPGSENGGTFGVGFTLE
jgi:hypothetical protein